MAPKITPYIPLSDLTSETENMQTHTNSSHRHTHTYSQNTHNHTDAEYISNSAFISTNKLAGSDMEYHSDSSVLPRPGGRVSKKRLDVQATIKETPELGELTGPGSIWAACIASELNIQEFLKYFRRCKVEDVYSPIVHVSKVFSEVIICNAFNKDKDCFIFKFGCVVGWDFDKSQRSILRNFMRPFCGDQSESVEEDDMRWHYAEYARIKKDTVELATYHIFERLAYSYAFAQSCKLAVFETLVDDTIEVSKSLPEKLATTGVIKVNRRDLGRSIGDLFKKRFYVNLHSDILDTPDIFWESDEFADQYSEGRSYLEIPKRVAILNQRLDIIKDLYDMLNSELTIQHGYKLEWIVIYLICFEVALEVIWNILIKDILKLV